MVDDVNTETAESKASAEALDRARLARERREAEQRKRLDELRAHAAAAQAQREKRDDERRKRQAEQRARDDDRRVQVEERKRAIWEASISRREALLQRERERTERLERARASRSSPRSAFAFGSSTPRLLEPVDSAGFFWAARRAASTTNVMFASAPLTRRASALHLDSDNDNKDEPDRQPPPAAWSSVARRRTDLVPTLPAPRAPGRAYSMTRLDKLPSRPLSGSPSMHHLNRTQPRSGDTTPGSRPASALSSAAPVMRRPAVRKPRPASIAGTGVNTPKGGVDASSQSVASTPSVSRDSTVVAASVPRRAATTPRRPRPASLHVSRPASAALLPGEGKPPVARRARPHERARNASASPARALSPSPHASKEPSQDKELKVKQKPADKNHVNAHEVSQKLEALQIQNGDDHAGQPLNDKVNEDKENQNTNVVNTEQIVVQNVEAKPDVAVKPVQEEKKELIQSVDEKIEKIEEQIEKVEEKNDIVVEKKIEEKKEKVEDKKEKVEEKKEKVEEKKEKVEHKKEKSEEKKAEEKKEASQEKAEENEMTASMINRRITTEEEAKAALAERRRRAREELERQAELDRQRLQREAEEEAERQRQEEERQRREEEEARELARLQRAEQEEKLRKAIEAQQQLERDEAERKVREEAERQARLKEDVEKRRAAEEAERLRREELARTEKERVARRQRVEAIMARTRLRKAEEETKQEEEKEKQDAPPAKSADNGNADLLGLAQAEESQGAPAAPAPPANNGNVTADLLGLSDTHQTEDKIQEQPTAKNQNNDNANPPETNNGNANLGHTPANVGHTPATNVGHISASFIQTERNTELNQKTDVKLLDDDFTTHNGHGAKHTHPLTLQNAI